MIIIKLSFLKSPAIEELHDRHDISFYAVYEIKSLSDFTLRDFKRNHKQKMKLEKELLMFIKSG